MNKQGQFTIIAALLVAVVLIAAVISTYSAIRYSPLQEQPQVLNAIDEINLALKQILGFTVGYYGSVLKVTGNTSYAQNLATNYLSSGLSNIGDIRPEWGISFDVNALELSANWFTNASYSQGTIEITYNLTGLGISGISYSTSSRLDVRTLNSNSSSQACLNITKDEGEPLINLGRNNLKFYRYVYESSAWELAEPTDITSYANGTYVLSLPSNVTADSYVIQVEDPRGIIVTASSFTRYSSTVTWNENYTFPDENIVVELLQNGTIRWLGQNLNLTSAMKPIPPIPVKAIHVSQTINGVNQEVPFQVEDWASEYRIPLGMSSDTTVFSNRQMIVFLVNRNVTKFTIWWNGSDEAIQTPLAYTNTYFNDNPSNRTLNNGILSLQVSASGFILNSTIGSVNSTARLMRINMENDTTNPEWAYVIVNGVIRDIIQGEAEWSGGAEDCPNVYSNIVITLPANTKYYTYQLRLMFINSAQQRTITDLCPIQLSTNLTSVQTMTENGTASGYPIVANGTGIFSNYTSGSWTPHHWSQIITGTKGAGIMFTDTANQRLYVFDSTPPGTSTGALKASETGNGLIQFVPVTLRQVQFTYAMDITWNGAVVTFDNTTPIYSNPGTPTGLWVLVEYPPTITVTAET
ncbi:hypothetical protein G4O51_05050 [Candidatus Bathyarchaeota archaeon A05DMB-2]|jgi:hypothetical protein|nr:hypothetical protein [Candidatus Bathyarchaeota archaeon A05DMB-2]